MKTGIELIQEERNRQITSENYTSKHDDEHVNGELAFASSCYTRFAGFQSEIERKDIFIYDAAPREWPWEPEYWKPSEDKIRNLVKAGALIAAEIDRLQRLDNHIKCPDCGADLKVDGNKITFIKHNS